MARSKTELDELYEQLLEAKKDGLLEAPSQSFFDRIQSNISGCFNRLYVRQFNFLSSKFNLPFRKSYYTAKKRIKASLGVRGYRFNELTPEFQSIYKRAQATSLALIKTQTEQQMLKMKSRLLDWVNLETFGGNKDSLKEAVKLEKNRYLETILRDQTGKLNASMDLAAATHFDAIAFIWRTHKDNRVVGKPGGLYPKGNEMHGNHYERDGKVYYYKSAIKEINEANISLASFDGCADDFLEKDGMPGIPINCRCNAENIYRIQDLPKSITYDKVT